jgi:formylglycine-generating enzyme required for sulfatase activity
MRGRPAAASSSEASASASIATSASPSVALSAAPIAASASELVVKAPPAAPVDMVPVRVGTLAFEIDRTEVTVEAYRACIAAGACTTTKEHGSGWDSKDAFHQHFVCNMHVEGRALHPINCVTFAQAQAFCAWAGKRLPKAREWETAASGAVHARYPWGNEAPTCARAVFARYGPEQWGCKDEPVGTAPVEAHPASASPTGALDMAGNVWEWTDDRDGALAVLRGGGWDSSESRLTIDATLEQAIFNGEVNVGFRCVR